MLTTLPIMLYVPHISIHSLWTWHAKLVGLHYILFSQKRKKLITRGLAFKPLPWAGSIYIISIYHVMETSLTQEDAQAVSAAHRLWCTTEGVFCQLGTSEHNGGSYYCSSNTGWRIISCQEGWCLARLALSYHCTSAPKHFVAALTCSLKRKGANGKGTHCWFSCFTWSQLIACCYSFFCLN